MVFIESRVGGVDSRGLHYKPGRARGMGRALVYSGPHGPPLVHYSGSLYVLLFKKSLQNVS